MSAPAQGLIAGLVFGLAIIGINWLAGLRGLTWPTAIFLNCFAIGVVVGSVKLPWPGWAVGLAFGLLLGMPEAVNTRTFGLNLVIAGVGGLLIGGIIHGWKLRR
jgi:ABC-type uncharacterized transport system permease subunit